MIRIAIYVPDHLKCCIECHSVIVEIDIIDGDFVYICMEGHRCNDMIFAQHIGKV